MEPLDYVSLKIGRLITINSTVNRTDRQIFPDFVRTWILKETGIFGSPSLQQFATAVNWQRNQFQPHRYPISPPNQNIRALTDHLTQNPETMQKHNFDRVPKIKLMKSTSSNSSFCSIYIFHNQIFSSLKLEKFRSFLQKAQSHGGLERSASRKSRSESRCFRQHIGLACLELSLIQNHKSQSRTQNYSSRHFSCRTASIALFSSDNSSVKESIPVTNLVMLNDFISCYTAFDDIFEELTKAPNLATVQRSTRMQNADKHAIASDQINSLYQSFLVNKYLPSVCEYVTLQQTLELLRKQYLRNNRLATTQKRGHDVSPEVLLAAMPAIIISQFPSRWRGKSLNLMLLKLLDFDQKAQLPSAQTLIASIQINTGLEIPVLSSKQLIDGWLGTLISDFKLVSKTPLCFYLLQEIHQNRPQMQFGSLGSYLVSRIVLDSEASSSAPFTGASSRKSTEISPEIPQISPELLNRYGWL